MILDRIYVFLAVSLITGCAQNQDQTIRLETECIFIEWEGNDLSAGKMILFSSEGRRSAVHVPQTAEIMIDGKKSNFDDLKMGMRLELFTRNMTIIKIVGHLSKDP